MILDIGVLFYESEAWPLLPGHFEERRNHERDTRLRGVKLLALRHQTTDSSTSDRQNNALFYVILTLELKPTECW